MVLTNTKLNYHTINYQIMNYHIIVNSFCIHDIEYNSWNSISVKSIFAYYIFYYIKNNLFQNINKASMLFCIVIENLKMVE